MTPAEQEAFAAFMRRHLPKPPGAEYHSPPTIFTDFANQTLNRRVHHWRDLTLEEARWVMFLAQKGRTPTPAEAERMNNQ